MVKKQLLRLTPILVLVLLMVLAYAFDLTKYVSFENIKQHREWIKKQVTTYPVLSPLLFMILYITAIALSLPGGSILTIFSGFIFPFPLSLIYVVIAATIGATLIFLAAKTALKSFLFKKARPYLQKMEKGFNQNVVSYLLFLRFIPLFPFWLVNLAPAFFGVRLWTYVWTTFIGILPGSFIYIQAGRGLGAIFDTGKRFSIRSVFNIEMRLALILLALFALLPILVKKWKKKSDR